LEVSARESTHRFSKEKAMKPFDMIVNGIIILGMFYLTFVMALAGWITSMRKGEAVTLLPERSSRTPMARFQVGFVLVSLVISALIIYLLWIPLPVSIAAPMVVIFQAGGLVLFLAGLCLTFWARRTLGAMWGISTSRQVKLLPDHRLIQNGPYAWVRHPMYLGWWVSILGLVLVYRTLILLGIFIMSLVIFYRRARLEESVLAEKFGDEWKAYAARSKCLIPFIY
jgi:protein-S-isoprenylcysteine O-methyltransferase Ste14